jgi:hypothetical protein
MQQGHAGAPYMWIVCVLHLYGCLIHTMVGSWPAVLQANVAQGGLLHRLDAPGSCAAAELAQQAVLAVAGASRVGQVVADGDTVFEVIMEVMTALHVPR